MTPQPAILSFLQEYQPQERRAIITLLASEHAIRTALTGIDYYLKLAGTPSPTPPDLDSDQPHSPTHLDPASSQATQVAWCSVVAIPCGRQGGCWTPNYQNML